MVRNVRLRKSLDFGIFGEELLGVGQEVGRVVFDEEGAKFFVVVHAHRLRGVPWRFCRLFLRGERSITSLICEFERPIRR